MEIPALIPRPASLLPTAGELVLDASATLAATADARPVERLVRSLLGPATGAAFGPGGEASTIRLELDHGASFPPEGYRLEVTGQAATLRAGELAGLRNGVLTLWQLAGTAGLSRAAVPSGIVLPGLRIEDAPRFSWRGGHLDVARHFMPLDFLFRFVDLLALHRLNVLHLHLNDDQGWRFASKAYPELTNVGAWRSGTRLGHSQDRSEERFDGTPHGGFYTHEQLGALVAYAGERNVAVVPEIDLPGHARAAIAAYPALGGRSEPLEVWSHWGVSEEVLELTPETMRFCHELWSEVLEVFPSRYVHLGGDECPRTQWRTSAASRARIAELGLSGPDALQNWFTRDLTAFLADAGRIAVGWDEILEGGPLPTGATVMSWRGERGGIVAASDGFDVVICPEIPCYFDHYQDPGPDEPLAIGGLNRLEDVYAYDPVPAELDPAAAHHVLGSQFLCWSEYLPDPAAVEYVAFPRAAALAEVLWSSGPRDFAEFSGRLDGHLARLDALGVGYRPRHGPRPWQRGGTGARRRFDRNDNPFEREA